MAKKYRSQDEKVVLISMAIENVSTLIKAEMKTLGHSGDLKSELNRIDRLLASTAQMGVYMTELVCKHVLQNVECRDDWDFFVCNNCAKTVKVICPEFLLSCNIRGYPS